MRNRTASLRHRVILGSAALVAAVVLSACTPTAEPDATAEPTSSSTSTPSPAPVPTFVPDGTAGDNLAVFTAITEQVWATEQRAEGRAYIDALVTAGFDKAAMQVTQDQTTVGNPVESMQFSVRIGAECLIGQVGPSTGEPVAVVAPVLAEDRCLVGTTRTIDW